MTPFVLWLALATASNVDLDSICRTAQSDALPEEKARAFESCIGDEKNARDQVRQRWQKASPEARADCAPVKGIPTSYDAMLTCLDMEPGGDFDAGNSK